MDKHETKIITRRASRGFGPGYKSHVECSCGYRSKSYDYKEWAATDAKAHKESASCST